MPKLAIHGGRAVRAKAESWPQWPMSDRADAKRLAEITASNRWSYDGPHEWNFAKDFTAYHGAKYGLCCANGTVAIQMALEALGVGAFDEVLVPGMTWQATAAACIDVNAVPVLVDVEADTWCIDAEKIEAEITKKTKAIIVVHLYGCMPDMTAIRKIARKRKLFLIEDCAHQPGSFWKGKGAGTLGDIGTFSFQESKVLSSGEGGFNLCKTKLQFERLYSLRNCGRSWQDASPNTLQSGNYRMTEWQAGMLEGGLSRLDAQVKRRDRNAMHLNAQLDGIAGVLPMRRRPEVTQQSYFNFAFRLDSKLGRVVGNRAFSKALNAELRMSDYEFEPPYQPLNRCELYQPQTKKRHRLNNDYWKAIRPGRFKLPVCKEAFERSGVVVHHAALLGTKRDMDDIATAVEKVVGHADRL